MTAVLLALVAFALADTSRVQVTPAPAPAYLEDAGYEQRLSLDFAVANGRADTLDLVAVELSVYDGTGRLALRRFVDDSGFSPGILAVTAREWGPGETRLVFNPFDAFDPALDLARLDFTFRFETRSGETVEVPATVRPRRFETDVRLRLPVAGRLLVWDGHDALAHHRRFDTSHPVAVRFGFRSNSMRYAHDLVVVDSAGAMHTGDGSHNADYYGFGAPVLAPADGEVVARADGQPDNEGDTDRFDPSALADRPMALFGNHVVIAHGDGSFSMLGHLRTGSVAVQVGDQVRQGQAVAAVGSSGSSYFPHLHYELRTAPGIEADGLPATFVAFERLLGARTVAVPSGAVDSGAFVRRTDLP